MCKLKSAIILKDRIFMPDYDVLNIKTHYVSDIENLYKASCLNFDEMFSYLGEGYGYGWHISDLKIYDKPRELSEFGRGCDAENISEIHCRDCRKLVSFDECCEVMCKPLNRPPQSYMFVEEVKK